MPNNNLAVAVDVAQLELSGLIGGSRIFLGGAQGRVHPDVYWLHGSENPTAQITFFTHRHFGQIVLSPLLRLTGPLPEQKRPSQQFRNYSQTSLTFKGNLLNVGKVLLLAKQTSPRRNNAWGRHRSDTKTTRRSPEMPLVTFVGSLCKIHAALCSKIANVDGIEVHDVRSWKSFHFRKIFRFLLHNTRDVKCTFASERPQVLTCGRQTCFVPQGSSKLGTPMHITIVKPKWQNSFTNIPAHQWQAINHRLFETKCCWFIEVIWP